MDSSIRDQLTTSPQIGGQAAISERGSRHLLLRSAPCHCEIVLSCTLPIDPSRLLKLFKSHI